MSHAMQNDLTPEEKLYHLTGTVWAHTQDGSYACTTNNPDRTAALEVRLNADEISFSKTPDKNNKTRFSISADAARDYIEWGERDRGGFNIPSKEERICNTLQNATGAVWEFHPPITDAYGKLLERAHYSGQGVGLNRKAAIIELLGDISVADETSEAGVKLVISVPDAERFAARAASTARTR